MAMNDWRKANRSHIRQYDRDWRKTHRYSRLISNRNYYEKAKEKRFAKLEAYAAKRGVELKLVGRHGKIRLLAYCPEHGSLYIKKRYEPARWECTHPIHGYDEKKKQRTFDYCPFVFKLPTVARRVSKTR
jgi:hypothetical protein